MTGTCACEDYEGELDRLTARLSDNFRGQIGPSSSVEELWALVPHFLGVKAPPAVVKIQLRRIGFHAEKKGNGWWLDLSKSRQLVSAAWGDDPET